MDGGPVGVTTALLLAEGLSKITTPLAGVEFANTAGERIIGVDLPADGNYPLGMLRR